jgi:dynein heavy chain
LTISLSLNCFFGCSPTGPAGTGKTETVKELAKLLGNYCVVFNCEEGMGWEVVRSLVLGSV